MWMTIIESIWDVNFFSFWGIWNLDIRDMRLISTEPGGKISRKETEEAKSTKTTYFIGME
jgi:hypothetical protein